MPALNISADAARQLERCLASDQKIVGRVRSAVRFDRVVERPGPFQTIIRDYGVFGRTAVIAVDGPIWFGESLWSLFWGGVSVENLVHAMAAAADDGAVDRVVLDTHSPGGDAAGLDELATAVRRLRAAKPVITLARDTVASQAYALACASTRIVGTPDCTVGSIGTYAVVYDTSAAAEKHGEKAIAVSTGGRKLLGVYGVPVGEAGADELRRMVAAKGAAFLTLAASARGLDEDTVLGWDGACFHGAETVTAGLVDEIASAADFWDRVDGGDFDTPPRVGTAGNAPAAGRGETAGSTARTKAATKAANTGASIMPSNKTAAEIKAEIDEMDEEEQKNLKAMLDEDDEAKSEDDKDEAKSEDDKDEAQSAAPAARRPSARPASFAQLNDAVPARTPNRDALIVKAMAEGWGVDRARSAALDAFDEAHAKRYDELKNAAALAAENPGAADGLPAARGKPKFATYDDAVKGYMAEGKSRVEAVKLANEHHADLREKAFA